MKSSIKNYGQVYTPFNIVNLMLDFIDYLNPDSILEKHIIDNSCGKGAFLVEIVNRYIINFLKVNSNIRELKEHLEYFIHGIEINKTVLEECIGNLNKVIKNYNLGKINWDIRLSDALKVEEFNGKMDFVVGNPPYVRIHNLNEDYKKILKKFQFINKGMFDLYISFFELGFKMLKSGGKLCYITPNSFFYSKAGENLRKYIRKTRALQKIIDLEHYQPFKGFRTYTVITLFRKNKVFQSIEYFTYDGKKLEKKGDISYDKIFTEDGKIFISSNPEFRKILSIKIDKKEKIVKNGFATLADKIFIADTFNFSSKFIIDCYKASAGRWKKCIFPYKENGEPYSLDEIKKYDVNLFQYLLEHKEILIKRNIKDKSAWYLYGRTQAIKDVFKEKLAINNMAIKDLKDLNLEIVPPGKGVYSGLYIITENLDVEFLIRIIQSQKFIDFVKNLKNYKNNGYYSFKSEDLEKYIRYYLNKSEGKHLQMSLF
jgi:adenine-specific DNA-methyltransferase